ADGLAGDGSLARGLAGFAFVLEHLGANEDEDQCAELDEILGAELRAHDELAAELMWGLAGRALYARERLARPTARALFDAAVARILDKGVPQPDGTIAWIADERFAGPTPRDAAGQPAGSLSVAHGTPGIVALLACSDDARAQAAARDGMRWIWAQRSTDGAGVCPVVAGGPPSAMPGWCYGDEGLATVLLAAARALGDEAWQARWREALRRCAGRAPSVERGLSLCHGAAGMAHLWHRVHQATGEPAFAAAARGWLDATLDGLGRAETDGFGLLDGMAGIALALAAFVSDVEPAWDRLFLLSSLGPARD
ncbi:MAG TPA: lanthionine synthetase LanC family protein, partial [Polyangia bacterium]